MIERARDGGELLAIASFMRINALSLSLSGLNASSVFADQSSIQLEGTTLVDIFQTGMVSQFLGLQQGAMKQSLSEARAK
jgi:hypothetical protein